MNIKSKYLTFFLYIFAILSLDFIFTQFILKKTLYWNRIDNIFFLNKDWRIKSNIYHHDIKKNINVTESWGSLKYSLITNSLGFRDNFNKQIKHENNKKKRIYINGDSFAEGVGYDYKDTVVGLINNFLSDKYDILNSAVTSYSPSIYFKKTQYNIKNGLEFDYCFIFLDISDIPDENFIYEDANGNILDLREQKDKNIFKKNIYKIGRIYRDNFSSGKIFATLRELTSLFKNKIKNRYLASRKFDKSFFSLTIREINLYKSTHVDRSMWTFDTKYSNKWKSKGIEKSSLYLKKLFQLLDNNNIDYYLIIYPNPSQILLNKKNIHEEFWMSWSTENNVKLVNLYKYFMNDDPKDVIERYFIEGDVHWNKKGHRYVFSILKEEILKNF